LLAALSPTDAAAGFLVAALPIKSESFMHPWRVGFAPAKPSHRKRRRRAFVTERQARRRQRVITTTLSRSEQSAGAIVPLADGPAVIVILLLSVALWGMVWAAVALAVSALS
jgi:hypothetical protein